MTARVTFSRLAHGDGLALPAYETAGAAGMDLRAAAELVIAAGHTALVPPGFAVAVPPGFEGQIRPRSGLAAKHGVTVLNTPGTIDSDYRGEIKIILVNHGERAFAIARGDRVAQMVVAPVTRVEIAEADGLDDTRRGAGGFGSTGR